jgi:spermidine synthase
VYAEKLPDARNFIADHEALFDTICMGCTDINRPLIDDMLGSSE